MPMDTADTIVKAIEWCWQMLSILLFKDIPWLVRYAINNILLPLSNTIIVTLDTIREIIHKLTEKPLRIDILQPLSRDQALLLIMSIVIVIMILNILRNTGNSK
jgi:hypothetical protein